MDAPAVSVENVFKTYRRGSGIGPASAPVLDGVSLDLSPGETLAVVGANGSGKTTLLKLLASLLLVDRGSIMICGHPVGTSPARASVGYVGGDERSFYMRLSAIENLRFFGALHGLRIRECDARAHELDQALGLSEFLKKRVDRCSSGMRARLALARAMLHRPPVLLLDEPTKSLDADHSERVRRALAVHSADGGSVIVATHVPPDAGDRRAKIVTLREGKLQYPGTAES